MISLAYPGVQGELGGLALSLDTDANRVHDVLRLQQRHPQRHVVGIRHQAQQVRPHLHGKLVQEAQLSPRDRAMRRVN